MKTFAVVSSMLALSGSAFAAPAPAPAPAPVTAEAAAAAAKPFGVIAAHSGSPVHLQSLNAAGEFIWIGKDTATYCPLTPKKDCPPGKYTDFVGGKNTLSMDVEVPGGQQVYIRKNGALGYTQAHSASIPAGATTTGFTISQGSSFGDLGHKGGFLACPTNNGNAPYKIFVGVAGFTRTDCIGFDALTSNSTTTGPAAWQYT